MDSKSFQTLQEADDINKHETAIQLVRRRAKPHKHAAALVDQSSSGVQSRHSLATATVYTCPDDIRTVSTTVAPSTVAAEPAEPDAAVDVPSSRHQRDMPSSRHQRRSRSPLVANSPLYQVGTPLQSIVHIPPHSTTPALVTSLPVPPPLPNPALCSASSQCGTAWEYSIEVSMPAPQVELEPEQTVLSSTPACAALGFDVPDSAGCYDTAV